MVVQWGGVNGTKQLRNTLIISKIVKSLLMIRKINILPLTSYYKGRLCQMTSLPAVLGFLAAWDGRDILKNFDILLTVHLNIFILILTNLML